MSVESASANTSCGSRSGIGASSADAISGLVELPDSSIGGSLESPLDSCGSDDAESIAATSGEFVSGALNVTTLCSPDESGVGSEMGSTSGLGSPELTGKSRITLVAGSSFPAVPSSSIFADPTPASRGASPLPMARSCFGFAELTPSEAAPRCVQPPFVRFCDIGKESTLGFTIAAFGTVGGVHIALGGVILPGSLVNGGFGGLSRLAASGTDEVKRSQKVGRFAIRFFAVECLGAGIRTPTPTGFSLC